MPAELDREVVNALDAAVGRILPESVARLYPKVVPDQLTP